MTPSLWLGPLAIAAALGSPLPDRTAGELDWIAGGLEAALSKARAEDKLTLIYFWMDGSEHCARQYGETLMNDQASTLLGDLVLLSADVADPAGAELVARYGVQTLPTCLVVGQDGVAEDAIIGFCPIATFVHEIDRIGKGEGTVSFHRAQVAAAPDDLAVRWQLATKLRDIGDRAGFEGELAFIKAADPTGETLVGANILLGEAIEAAQDAAQNDPAQVETEALEAFLATTPHDQIAFDGWQWITRLEQTRGSRAGWRRAVRKAAERAPDDSLTEFGYEVARGMWEQREELSKADMRLALDLAQRGYDRLVTNRTELETKWDEEQGGTDPAAQPNEEELAEKRNMDEYQAMYLEAIACCFYMNGKRRLALETLETAMELVPGYKAVEDRYTEFKNRE